MRKPLQICGFIVLHECESTEGEPGGICSGSGSTAHPLWDSLLYYVKASL